MRCTRRGCKNIQCYVCSKSCDYSHFNDPGRGGKAGNCPLFDVTENRHEEEIRIAQEEAKKLAAEKNPGVNLELLDIKMSDKVTEDDERRRRRDPYVNQRELYLDEANNLGAEVEAAFAGVGVGAVGAVGAVGVGARAVAGALAGIVPAFRPQVQFRQLLYNVQEQGFQDQDAAALRAVEEELQIEAAHVQAAEAHQAALIQEARVQVAQGVQIQQAQAAQIQAAQARAQVQAELAQLPDNFGQMMQRAAHDREQHIRRQQDVRQPQDPVQQLHNELQQLENLGPYIPQRLVMEPPKKHRGQLLHRPQRQQQQRQQLPQVLRVLPPQPVQLELPQQRQMPCRQPAAPTQAPVQNQQNQQQQPQIWREYNVYQRPQQVDVANPNGNNKNAVPAAGQNAAQGPQPQAGNRVQGWLNRLQGFDLGFGPLQRLDFGRGFPSHGRAQIQGAQQDLLNPWIDDPGELHVRWADRAVPFGARYGALGQAPGQQP